MSIEKLESIRFEPPLADSDDHFDSYVRFTRNYRFSRIDDRFFKARAVFWKLGEFAITETQIGALLAERTEAEVAAAPADYLTFVAIFEGGLDYRSNGTVTPCRTGDIVLLDYRQSFAMNVSGKHSATISVARGVLEAHLGPRAITGRLPHRAETTLLFQFVRTLIRQLPGLPLASAYPVADILKRLILLALGGVEQPVIVSRGGGTRSRAIAFMDTLPHDTLDIAAMTRSLGIKRATLYRSFQCDGGVKAFDRNRRLRRLYLALCEAPRHVSLSELGERHGFHDMSSLARQFRALFGHSMSQVRDRLPTLQPVAERDDPLAQYRYAMGYLSSEPSSLS